MQTKNIIKVSAPTSKLPEGLVMDTMNGNSAVNAPSIRAVNEAVAGLQSEKVYNYTILASNWVGNTYTIEHSSITSDNRVYLTPGFGITVDQLSALQGANLIEYQAQEVGKGYVKAIGEVPTIDIPVRLIV